jgi:hypothetical protein
VKLETGFHPVLKLRNMWSYTSISQHYFIPGYIARYLQQRSPSREANRFLARQLFSSSFYGILMFIIAFITARRLSLSYAR